MSESNSQHVCSICLEKFTNPKILECFHTYCLQCLEDLVNKTSKLKHFICPVCSRKITVPEGGVKMFTSNFYIEDTPASSGRSNDFCSHHPTNAVDFYCEDCTETVCSKCVVILHKGHTCLELDLEDTIQGIRDNLNSLRKTLQATTVEFQDLSDILKANLSDIKDYAKIARLHVDTQVEKLCSEIRKFGDEIKDEIKQVLVDDEAKLFKLIQAVTKLNDELRVSLILSQTVLEDASIVKVVNIIPKVRKLQIVSDCLKLDFPDLRYPWFEQVELKNTFLIKSQLGSLEMLSRPVIQPPIHQDHSNKQLATKESCFIATFKAMSIKQANRHLEVVHGLTWCVDITACDTMLTLRMCLSQGGNPTVRYCDANFTIKLMTNKDTSLSMKDKDTSLSMKDKDTSLSMKDKDTSLSMNDKDTSLSVTNKYISLSMNDTDTSLSMNDTYTSLSVMKQNTNCRFKPGDGFVWDNFIEWTRLTDPQNGFIDEDKKYKIQVTLRITDVERAG